MIDIDQFDKRHPGLRERVWGQPEKSDELPEAMNSEEAFLAWATVCAVLTADNLLNYYTRHQSPTGEDGVEWMTRRFEQVANWTKKIWETARKVNKDLYTQLSSPVVRDGDGVVPAMAMPSCWGGSRLALLMIEEGQGEKVDTVLTSSLKESKSPAQFLVNFAEGVYSTGVEPGKIMDFVLKKHQADDYGMWDLYGEVVFQLKGSESSFAREVWAMYDKEKNSLNSAGWVKMLIDFEDSKRE